MKKSYLHVANEVLVQGETSLRGSVNATINATTPFKGRFGGQLLALTTNPKGFPVYVWGSIFFDLTRMCGFVGGIWFCVGLYFFQMHL